MVRKCIAMDIKVCAALTFSRFVTPVYPAAPSCTWLHVLKVCNNKLVMLQPNATATRPCVAKNTLRTAQT
jgi:hypothetical protein